MQNNDSQNTGQRRSDSSNQEPVRRWPFRCDNEADRDRINAEISKVLQGVEDMIYKLVRRRVYGPVCDEDMVDEIVQKCMIWLWERSLPKFDTSKGVKLTTFLYKCIQNFVHQEIRTMARQNATRAKHHNIERERLLEVMQARDTSMDDKVIELADDIIDCPEKYLTNSQSRVLRALLDMEEGDLMKDLAVDLDYQRASSLSMMKRRIKDRISDIDIENFGLEES